MPSFSPYSLSVRFAKNTVGHLNRVWAGRVSKPASTQHRSRSSQTGSPGVIHHGPEAHPPRRQPGDGNIPESDVQSGIYPTIKQEDDDDSPALISGKHRIHHIDVESDEDELDERWSEDRQSNPPDGFVTPHGLDGRDEPIRSIEDFDESLSGVGASPSLRGGHRIHNNVNVTNEDQNKEGDDSSEDTDNADLESRTNMDEYYESEDNFDVEYDVDSEDIAGYRIERTQVRGIATWPQEVARAHKIIALRGAYSLMPSSWNWDLIDHPFVEGLFAPADSGTKLLVREHSNQFRATRALRNLFELHIRICAYRQSCLHHQIANLIEKEIRAYNLSVEKDFKLHGYYDFISPLFFIKFGDLQTDRTEEGETLGAWMHQQAVLACQTRVEQHHSEWAAREVKSYPRFIYTFVIIQQTVLIWMIDTDQDEAQEPYALVTLDMSNRTAWLETSLAIAITVHLARESICAHRLDFPRVEDQDDDPDA